MTRQKLAAAALAARAVLRVSQEPQAVSIRSPASATELAAEAKAPQALAAQVARPCAAAAVAAVARARPQAARAAQAARASSA
jgi:hypothetical protein